MDAVSYGKKVLYIDTEGNLSKVERENFSNMDNMTYMYEPRFNMLKHHILTMKQGFDYVIVDSVGYPILVKFALMNMKERGSALLELIAINGKLKEYCKDNSATARITTQPESEFNKDKTHRLRPFGDKSQFATKEIFELVNTSFGQVTKSDIVAFRSREVGRDTKIGTIEVNAKGTIIK